MKHSAKNKETISSPRIRQEGDVFSLYFEGEKQEIHITKRELMALYIEIHKTLTLLSKQ